MKVDKKWLRKALQDVSTFGQMGFTIVVPPVMLCILANFLVRKFNFGPGLIIAALVIGLLCSFTSIYKLCRFYLYKNTRDSDKDSTISYRKHL